MPQDNNAFAEYGTLCHELLEDWANGEKLAFELADAYAERFDTEVVHYFPPFPRDMGQRYYDAGHQYFLGFDGFGSQYEVVAAEQRFTLQIAGWPFVGVMDLVLRDKTTGKLIVIDHKSKSAKTMKQHMSVYRKQLYLYAAAVEQAYGEPPSHISFNLFRENEMVTEAYDPAVMAEVLQWVEDMIATILSDDTWEARPSRYFCDHICASADFCPKQQGESACM